jgi:hypothetical protein
VISIALAALLYLESSGAIGSLYDRTADFFLPYLFFVVSAFFFAGRFRKHPVTNAAAGLSAIGLGALVYPKMYESIDWIYRKSEGGFSSVARAVFREARSMLGWIWSAGLNQYPTFHDEAVLRFVVVITMVLFFLLSGLVSRLFVLSKPSTDGPMVPSRLSVAAATRFGPNEKRG